MYDYDDYEEDVLLVLRVLKYLHGVQTREEFLKTLNHCTEAGMDELYELADTVHIPANFFSRYWFHFILSAIFGSM